MPKTPYRFRGSIAPTAAAKRPIRAEKPAPDVADGIAKMRLYDVIDSWGGFWGISSKEFNEALDELGDVSEIHLHINSPGGEVWEGIAMMNALRRHPAKVTAIVDGLAASAASFLAASADEVVMGRNTELMIHDAWGIEIGPAADMHSMGDRLDKMSNNIAGVYADKASGTIESWRGAMLAETWYDANEAVAAGLADRIEGDTDTEAKNAFDLSVFKHPGRAQAPAPERPAPVDPAPAGDEQPTPEVAAASRDRLARHNRRRHEQIAARHRLTA